MNKHIFRKVHSNLPIVESEDIPKPIRDKMEEDKFIFGNGFCLKKEDGTFERIDPMRVVLNPSTKEFIIKDKK